MWGELPGHVFNNYYLNLIQDQGISCHRIKATRYFHRIKSSYDHGEVTRSIGVQYIYYISNNHKNNKYIDYYYKVDNLVIT